MREHALPTENFETLVFVPEWTRRHEASHLLRTAGVIGALRAVGGVLPRALASIIAIFPRRLRDAGYRMVGRWRYRVFGPWRPRPLARRSQPPRRAGRRPMRTSQPVPACGHASPVSSRCRYPFRSNHRGQPVCPPGPARLPWHGGARQDGAAPPPGGIPGRGVPSATRPDERPRLLRLHLGRQGDLREREREREPPGAPQWHVPAPTRGHEGAR